MEKEILKKLNFDMKHPKPTDFLERFSQAAKVRSCSNHQLSMPTLSCVARNTRWQHSRGQRARRPALACAHVRPVLGLASTLTWWSTCRQLESTKRTNQQYTKSYSMTLYFIDMAFLDETLAHNRPSLIAAAGSPLPSPHTLWSSSPLLSLPSLLAGVACWR